jgi:hypothetical protein
MVVEVVITQILRLAVLAEGVQALAQTETELMPKLIAVLAVAVAVVEMGQVAQVAAA